MVDRLAKYYKVAEWSDKDGYLVTARAKDGRWGAPSVFGKDKKFNTEDEVLEAFIDGRDITLELHVQYGEAYFKWLDSEINKGLEEESNIILTGKDK